MEPGTKLSGHAQVCFPSKNSLAAITASRASSWLEKGRRPIGNSIYFFSIHPSGRGPLPPLPPLLPLLHRRPPTGFSPPPPLSPLSPPFPLCPGVNSVETEPEYLPKFFVVVHASNHIFSLKLRGKGIIVFRDQIWILGAENFI